MSSKLTLSCGTQIAYHSHTGSSPTVVFLGGFRSDMTGSKAMALDAHCQQKGLSFLRFDYQGHGQSSGAFEEGTIGLWIGDALAIITTLTKGPLILIGSSMGSWIMLHVALMLQSRIAGLIGVASAPDFTIKLMWDQLSVKQQTILSEQGRLEIPSDYSDEPYVIVHRLIEESRNHVLLDNPIAIDCPVHLLHGMHDSDVPWQISTKLAEKLTSNDVELTLLKSGNHRLSSPDELACLLRSLDRMIEKTR